LCVERSSTIEFLHFTNSAFARWRTAERDWARGGGVLPFSHSRT
jgi:hypothetical protein